MKQKKKSPISKKSPDDPCGYCKCLRKEHEKPGEKPDTPHFRSLAKAGKDRTNTDYFPTSKWAFCKNICDCIHFIEKDGTFDDGERSPFLMGRTEERKVQPRGRVLRLSKKKLSKRERTPRRS